MMDVGSAARAPATEAAAPALPNGSGRAGRAVGYACILAAAALWGLIGPVARVALARGVTPLEIGFWRAALAAVLFAVHAGVRRRLRIAPRDLPVALWFGLTGIALLYGSYFLAVRATGAALASVLLYTAPAWVAVAARFVLHEPMSRRKVLAVAITLGGTTLVALGSGGTVHATGAGIAWGLASGWAYALYYVTGKRFLARYDTSTLFVYALPFGALVLAPFAHIGAHPRAAWLAIAAIAVLSTYAAYLFYGAAVKRLEASRASILANFEPVVASVLAFGIWGERLGAGALVGAALVLAGAVLVATG